MKQLQEKLLALLLIFILSGATASAQKAEDRVITFRFLPGGEMFILAGNEAELERLYGLIDHHKAEIAKGNMPVYVDGYCASLSTTKENLNMAFARANRVKSELIIRKGLKEADFITANYARAYEDNKDIVVVTLRIPSAKATPKTTPVKERVKREEPQPNKDAWSKKRKPPWSNHPNPPQRSNSLSLYQSNASGRRNSLIGLPSARMCCMTPSCFLRLAWNGG